jgi:hypothetical protein
MEFRGEHDVCAPDDVLHPQGEGVSGSAFRPIAISSQPRRFKSTSHREVVFLFAFMCKSGRG